MGRIALLHGANRSSILLATTILFSVGIIILITPKYKKQTTVKDRECLHLTRTEFGLCESCGDP